MESSQVAPAVEQRSTRYLIFLVVVMGLVSQLDGWLSLIESTAVPFITTEFFAGDASAFALWQGLFGIIVFLVFMVFVKMFINETWSNSVWIALLSLFLLYLLYTLIPVLYTSLSQYMPW